MLDLKPYHLLFTLLLFGIFSTNHACNQIDRDSLSSLAFNRMSSPPLNWSSIDCCQWEGIYCDRKCRVNHIWLPSKGLSGSISPYLGNLTHLSYLNLSHNSVLGPLPKGLFSSLNQLKVIDLSYNHLFGDIFGWPASLQIVDISSNQFSETIQSSFIQRAWRLIELNVSNNSFMGPIPSFPCFNSSFVSLLDFSHNHHSGQIPCGLGACSKLKVFRAGFNSLSGLLPHDIYNATGLDEISLPFNNLSGPISSDIVKLAKLTNLELYGNKLSGNLPLDIGKLSKLKHLLLDENSLTSSLPPSLVNCTNLTKLTLRSNFLEGNISTFNFSSLHQLIVIDLGDNKFSGNLPISLYSCKSLTAIRLSRNQLEGQIQPEVLQLKFLSFLSISFNRLTNITGAIKILTRCKTLTIVILGGNFLHEAMPSDDNIVDSDGFENLRMFSLAACQLTGQLPIWLSRLKKLEVLKLDSNHITGSIPNWLSTLPRLFRLYLSNNLISGEFPKEFCGLQTLVSPKALVNHNHLDLPIFIGPSPFGQIVQLNFLSSLRPAIIVANNNLSGNIPIEIGCLKLLSVLNFSHNIFSGSIPNQISELTNLEVLDLSANQLSGEIPASLSSLHFLNAFSVANNNLHGPIPSGTQLQSFDASAYEGNPELCGPPLPHDCAHIVSNKGDIRDEDNGHKIPWFHITVVLGFITGFWGVCGPLAFSYKWRVAYFQFMDNLKGRCIIFFFKIAYWSF
ncbi:receptor-like protein 2 [Corylus avellana]|uniref:receptor-like protein 2 n=1 Tax=Corylus avellana TaxID=13451 RepID=UPI00286B4C1A|nr:receptor-like protein 2 [Corylus avellana]